MDRCNGDSYIFHCFALRHNSRFLYVLIFPSFWAKSLRSQTLMLPCGTRSASVKEMHASERNNPIVLGFYKSCARTIAFYSPTPRLAQVFCHVPELVPSAHLSYAMCAEGTNSGTWQKTCASLGLGLQKAIVRARTIWKNPKLWGRFAQMHVHFFDLCTSCSTQKQEGLGPK